MVEESNESNNMLRTEIQIEEVFKRGVLIPFKAQWKAFFVLDSQSYEVHVYKSLEQEKVSQTFNICGGTFPELVRKFKTVNFQNFNDLGIVSDPQEGILIESFEYRTCHGFQFTVVSDSQEKTNEIKAVFEAASVMPALQAAARRASVIEQKKTKAARFVSATKQAGSTTWRMGNYVVLSLERIGESVDSIPGRVSRQVEETKGRTVIPSNAVSGVAYGTKAMLGKVFSAVAGVIIEPVKGAKRGGVKGGAVGFGKGMLGLVCKPVKGTIDLVTQTTRGISNTPKTMYVAMNKMIRKKSRSQSQTTTAEEVNQQQKDHTVIAEQGDELLYISKRQLQEQIQRSQLLSTLLYQSEISLNDEEQNQIKEIIQRQRALLAQKETELMTGAEKTQQIKQITKELLDRLNRAHEAEGSPSKQQEFEMEQQSRHESDSSSLANEKEVHNKLTQILSLIGDVNNQDEAGADIVRSEEEFSRKMAEEVYDEISEGNDDLDLYQIQADELEENEVDISMELQKIAFQFFPEYEEEEKQDEQESEAERLFQDKANWILEQAVNFTPSTLTGDHRCPNAGYYGGFAYNDKAVLSKLRGAATEIVKMVGKKLFSGNFDLTKISFPIKCMTHVSALEAMPTVQSTMTIYLNKAASTNDPVERMKLLMAHNISFFYKEKLFEKPLNPILGETFQARGQDGAYIFMEQTSHHPPVSHWLLEGPRNNYKMTGWSQYYIKMGMQSANLIAQGHKLITFKDGQKISYNAYSDYLFNIFMGTMGHQLTGKITFTDEQNQIEGWYEPGKYKMKTQDYICGEIQVRGKKVCEIYGNYMGFVDFDGKRYWDIREAEKVWFPIVYPTTTLQSDSTKRLDSVTLRTGNVPAAQEKKELLEAIQRNDRKLREEAEKRRAKGGQKYVMPQRR